MLAILGRTLGIFWPPSIRTLPALIRHIEFPFLWLGRRAESQWRRTNHMDCWMDGLLVLTVLKARGAGWVPARLAIHHFSDFVWHGFSWAFWDGFGIDFEAILEHLHIILAPKTAPSISCVFLRFSMQKWNPSTLENSIITWYSRKKQRNLTFRFYIHFMWNGALMLACISHYFG